MKKLHAVICVMFWAAIPGNAGQCAPTGIWSSGPNLVGCPFVEKRGPEDIFLFAFWRRGLAGFSASVSSERNRKVCVLPSIAPPKSKKENRDGSHRFYKQATPNGVTASIPCRVGDSEEGSDLRVVWMGLDESSINGDSSNDVSSKSEPSTSTNENSTAFHHIPKPSQKFSTWKKVNPVWWFGNADDPVPPRSYRKGKCCRKFMWYMRNPFHNFDHYVIGIGDKHFTRVGRFPDRQANPNGGWNWAVCRYRNLRLPFVDYQRGGFEFYCGWRNGGNFGMKLNFGQKRAATPTKGA